MNSTKSFIGIKKEQMQNFTVRERVILAALIMSFLLGAGHRLWKANFHSSDNLSAQTEQVNHAED
tara:strand:- start:322 stop:516 length:195 start_codon:yes stop_codon:yes gene_type:complete